MTLTKHTKLKLFLESYGLNPSEFFELMKHDEKTKGEPLIYKYQISGFINGRLDMTVNTILRICKKLKCTPNDILNFEEELD